MERTVIKASAGMILTNGEVFGREIYLADGMTADTFTEITEEQYAQIMAEVEGFPEANEESFGGSENDPLAEDAATVADYRAALREFGVNV